MPSSCGGCGPLTQWLEKLMMNHELSLHLGSVEGTEFTPATLSRTDCVICYSVAGRKTGEQAQGGDFRSHSKNHTAVPTL